MWVTLSSFYVIIDNSCWGGEEGTAEVIMLLSIVTISAIFTIFCSYKKILIPVNINLLSF